MSHCYLWGYAYVCVGFFLQLKYAFACMVPVAPESVHRGLGELVSGGGLTTRDPPSGSPSPGRARAARPRRGVGTAHRAQAGGAGGLGAGLGTAHPGRPRRRARPGGSGLACPQGAARRAGTARPRAPVCALDTARWAQRGHLLSTPGCYAQQPDKGVLHSRRIAQVEELKEARIILL